MHFTFDIHIVTFSSQFVHLQYITCSEFVPDRKLVTMRSVQYLPFVAKSNPTNNTYASVVYKPTYIHMSADAPIGQRT